MCRDNKSHGFRYIFIFPLKMGIFGAVLATGLAPVICLIVLSKHWLTKQNQFHFVRIKPSFRSIGTIISLGVPANLSLVVISIYTGIAQGTQPILSRVYGYGEHESQKQILKYALKTMLVISLGIYPFFLLTANPIVSIFNSEQNMQLQEIATAGLKLYFTAIPFVWFNIINICIFCINRKSPACTNHFLVKRIFNDNPYGILPVFYIKNDRCMAFFSSYRVSCHFSGHCIIY